MAVVALPIVKGFLNLEATTADDAELGDMTERAETILSELVGPLGPVTVTDEVHTGPGPLQLRRIPVLAVTSATSDGYPVADLDLDGDTGILYGTFGYGRRRARVTYTAGRDALPYDLEAAVLELVGHLWESQRRPMHGRPGFSDSEVNPEIGIGSKYLLPYRVQTLIQPHLLPVMA